MRKDLVKKQLKEKKRKEKAKHLHESAQKGRSPQAKRAAYAYGRLSMAVVAAVVLGVVAVLNIF